MGWQITPPSMMPSMPPLPAPPSSIMEWQNQWQCPGLTMGVPVSSTGPSFSGCEQQMPAQQQTPLLHIPTVGQNCNYLPTSEIPTHQLRNIDDIIAQTANSSMMMVQVLCAKLWQRKPSLEKK